MGTFGNMPFVQTSLQMVYHSCVNTLPSDAGRVGQQIRPFYRLPLYGHTHAHLQLITTHLTHCDRLVSHLPATVMCLFHPAWPSTLFRNPKHGWTAERAPVSPQNTYESFHALLNFWPPWRALTAINTLCHQHGIGHTQSPGKLYAEYSELGILTWKFRYHHGHTQSPGKLHVGYLWLEKFTWKFDYYQPGHCHTYSPGKPLLKVNN